MWDEMKITLEFCSLSLTGRALNKQKKGKRIIPNELRVSIFFGTGDRETCTFRHRVVRVCDDISAAGFVQISLKWNDCQSNSLAETKAKHVRLIAATDCKLTLQPDSNLKGTKLSN
jgi:hypothetical protein